MATTQDDSVLSMELSPPEAMPAGEVEEEASPVYDLPGNELRNAEWWASPESAKWTHMLLTNQAGTLTEVPGKLTLAVAQARESVSSWTLSATDATSQVAGWRLLLLLDRLLFAELYSNTDLEQMKPVADRVAERLDLFWAGDWDNLCCLTHVRLKSRTQEGGLTRTASRLRGLLQKGEMSKASRLAWGSAVLRDVETTGSAFHHQQGLPPNCQLVDGEDAGAEEAMPQASIVAAKALATDVETMLKSMWAKSPRWSGAGPLGDRYEHYFCMAQCDGSGSATAELLSRLVSGDVPPEVKNLALAAKLIGLAKKDDGTRVVASGGVPRRLVGKAVCKSRAREIQEAAGPAQYGVNVSAGAETIQKIVTAASEEQHDFAFVRVPRCAVCVSAMQTPKTVQSPPRTMP